MVMGRLDWLFPWKRDYEKKSLLPKLCFHSFLVRGRYISIAHARYGAARRGISSRHPNKAFQKHVLMLDIDSPLPLEIVIHRLSEFQSRHRLPDLYVIRTKSGYHVYCLAMFSLVDLLQLSADLADLVDVKYIAWLARKRHAVLRVEGEDLHHVVTLQGRKVNRPCSLPHARYLHERLGIEVDLSQSSCWVRGDEVREFEYRIPR